MRCCWRFWPGRTGSIRGSMARSRARSGTPSATARPACASASSRKDSACLSPTSRATPWCGKRPSGSVGTAIWLPIAAEGATMQMMLGNGFGFNWQGLYVNSLLDAHSNWRNRADELSDTLKNTMLLGHYMVTRHRGHYYAKAQNLVRRLRAAYDSVLAQYDLLAMPTLPMAATQLPPTTASTTEIIQRAFEVLPNTAPFDCTHHPSMSIPCGLADGLPVGLMLTGKMYDEA